MGLFSVWPAKRRRAAKKKAKGPSEKSGKKRKRRVRRHKSRRKQVGAHLKPLPLSFFLEVLYYSTPFVSPRW